MSIRTKLVLTLVVAAGFSVASGLVYWKACQGILRPVRPVSRSAVTKARLARRLVLALEHHGNDSLGCASTSDKTGQDLHLLALIGECEAATGGQLHFTESSRDDGKRGGVGKQEEAGWLSDLRNELAAHAELVDRATSLPAEMSIDRQQAAQQMTTQHYRERIIPLGEQYAANAHKELEQQAAIIAARIRGARTKRTTAAVCTIVVALVGGLIVAQMLTRRLGLTVAVPRHVVAEPVQQQRQLDRRTGDRASDRIDVSASSGNIAAEPDTRPETPLDSPAVFDVVRALHQSDGDAELLADLIDMAIASLPTSLADLNDFIDRNCLEQASQVADAIKGMCGGIGAHETFAAAFACEVAAHRGDADQARDMATVLAEALGRLASQLVQYQAHTPATRNDV